MCTATLRRVASKADHAGFLRRCTDHCSCCARRSVRGRQPSHRKLDLSVGELPPVLDDWQVTALQRLIDDFAGLQTGRINRQRENLSPLERFELGQLKIVGIVWDIKEPRAMIEDSAGLGYVVKIGTPIGSNDGKVKTIHRDQIVIEENYTDAYGGQKKRDVRMRLSTE